MIIFVDYIKGTSLESNLNFYFNGNKGITIEYLKCRADLNFDDDFRVNGFIGMIVTKWDLILLE